MGTKNVTVKFENDVEKYKIHNFIRKMFQEDVFDRLIEYIDSHIKARRGEDLKFRQINPISINLDLITTCNYYCNHCIDLDIINNGHSLKVENIKRLINHWAKKGLKSVIIIGGGEPVLHPNFEEIITFLKSRGLELGIASNGSFMSRLSNIAHLLNSRDWIRLSLDAGTDKIFKKIHNPKANITLDQILTMTKKMRDRYSGYQMGFSFLVISDEHIANNKQLVNNIEEIPLAAKRAKENRFSYFSVKPFILPSGGRPTKFHRQFIKQIIKQVEAAKELEDEHFKVIESVNLLTLFDGSDEKLKIQPKICHAQFFRLAVCPTGIFNCTLWRGFDKNYLINTQEEINEQYFQKFQDKLTERLENFDAAKECNEVSCIYNDFNWFIEDMINNPEKIKALKKTNNFYDYFL